MVCSLQEHDKGDLSAFLYTCNHSINMSRKCTLHVRFQKVLSEGVQLNCNVFFKLMRGERGSNYHLKLAIIGQERNTI